MMQCLQPGEEKRRMKADRKLYPLSDVQAEIRKKRYRLATRQGYLELLKSLVIIGVILMIAFSKVFLVTVARGMDMFPAIQDGDIVLGYRLDSRYLKNDVVVYEDENKTRIARVVAKAGDSVDITEDGVLYVNGTEQSGEIVYPTVRGEQEYPFTVPEDCVYVLGDYRTVATDSRKTGPVRTEKIKAKVVSLFRRRGI